MVRVRWERQDDDQSYEDKASAGEIVTRPSGKLELIRLRLVCCFECDPVYRMARLLEVQWRPEHKENLRQLFAALNA